MQFPQLIVSCLFTLAKEQTDTIKPCQSNQRINDPAEGRRLPSKEVGNQIVTEQPDQQPI